MNNNNPPLGLGCAQAISASVRAILKRQRRTTALASTAVLVLSVEPGLAQERPSQTQSDTSSLQEIVVTAQRRAQNIEDVPYNISVVGQDQITASGVHTIDELTRIVTGLTTVDQGPGSRAQTNNLVLRGLRTESPGGGISEPLVPGLTADTVSTYFGETPIFFQMVLQDVERVEVLRGPQGTLYGSGAEGGTIRFIPRRPSFDAFSGELSVSGSGTMHADGANGDAHGFVNIPITDTLAARVVAGVQHLAGFIEGVNFWELDSHGVPLPSIPGNLNSGPIIAPAQKGINSSDQWYARGALRWAPSSSVDLQFDYLHQRTTMGSSQQVSPTWPGGCRDQTAVDQGAPVSCQGPPPSTFYANPGGPYTTASFGLQPYEDNVDLGSLVGTFDFGFATLTSATSYFYDSSVTTGDETGALENIGGANYNNFPPYNNYPRFLALTPTPATTKSFVQEIRLASNGGHFLDYVAGVFYQNEKEDTNFFQAIPGLGAYDAYIGMPFSSPYGDVADILIRNTKFEDAALFGELTAHLTPKWQLTFGGRLFHQTFSDQFYNEFPIQNAEQLIPPPDTATASGTISRTFNDHLIKINTAYDIVADTKIYATYSEGFRHGGTNALPTVGPYASLQSNLVFQPDFAKNFEVGIKGTAFQHRVRYSLALYRVNLNDFQFDARSGSDNPATFNGSKARSQGVEVELQAAVSRDLNILVGYSYTDAKTTAQTIIHDYPPYALIPAFGGTGTPEVLYNIPSGARLPGVPYNTANFGIDYTVPVALFGHDSWKLTLHTDGVYRDNATGDIDSTSLFYWTIPSSIIINARATVNFATKLGLDLFVTNITGDHAYSGSANVQQIPNPYALRIVSRPRTIGMTLRYDF